MARSQARVCMTADPEDDILVRASELVEEGARGNISGMYDYAAGIILPDLLTKARELSADLDRLRHDAHTSHVLLLHDTQYWKKEAARWQAVAVEERANVLLIENRENGDGSLSKKDAIKQARRELGITEEAGDLPKEDQQNE